LGVASPFFRDVGLDVEWVHPGIPMSHPLGGGRSGALLRDVEETATGFGADRERYLRMRSKAMAWMRAVPARLRAASLGSSR
jgi:phytoene dehydrogenase-like protein